ncbi:MAG TPA: hypothetical protein DDY87_07375 [Clostridiales bacterium]|nr:hypothetical protein [Clostridiales bacterium]
MKWGKQMTLFTVGGSAYVALELLYRGRSHISMFGAGGLCFLLIGALRKKRLPALAKLAGGAAIITGVELVTGLLCNRDFSVWDYRGQPGNFLGQICPLFAAVWIPVGAAGMTLHGLTEALLDRKPEYPAIGGKVR